MRAVFFLTLFVSLSFNNIVFAADAKVGEKVFRRCMACHFADKEQHKIGPSLKNIIGRRAGTAPGYTYSAAMVNAGKQGLIWNKENLEKYLHSPRQFINGTKMFGVNLKSDTDIDDLIEYLESFSDKEDVKK